MKKNFNPIEDKNVGWSNIGWLTTETLLFKKMRNQLQETLEVVLQQTRMDAAIIYGMDDFDNGLSLLAGVGFSQSYLTTHQWASWDGFVGEVFLCGEMRISENNEDDPRFKRGGSRKEGYHSVIAVPLWGKENVLGVLMLAKQEVRHFSTEEINGINNSAQKVMSRWEELESMYRLEWQSRTAQVLYRVGSQIYGLEDTNDICKIVAQELQVILPLEGILIIFTKNNLIELLVNTGNLTNLASDDINYLLNNASERKAFEKIQTTTGREIPVLLLPLIINKRTKGFISLSRKKEQPFSLKEQRFAIQMARVTSVALSNAYFMLEKKQLAILEERNRLAKELHDSLSQTLATIGFEVEIVSQHMQNGNLGECQKAISHLKDIIALANLDIREAIQDLYILKERNDSTSSTIKSILENYTVTTGLVIETDIQSNITLDPFSEVQLVRILTEVLTNVRKHAKASSIFAKLTVINNEAVLSVRDNGCGFRVNELTRSRMYGLSIIQERAASVTGRTEIISNIGEGTIVNIFIPL